MAKISLSLSRWNETASALNNTAGKSHVTVACMRAHGNQEALGEAHIMSRLKLQAQDLALSIDAWIETYEFSITQIDWIRLSIRAIRLAACIAATPYLNGRVSSSRPYIALYNFIALLSLS